MTKPRLCDECKQAEAIYAMQFVGEERPTFSRLGWHYRGFRIIAQVCGACSAKIENDAIYQRIREHAMGCEGNIP